MAEKPRSSGPKRRQNGGARGARETAPRPGASPTRDPDSPRHRRTKPGRKRRPRTGARLTSRQVLVGFGALAAAAALVVTVAAVHSYVTRGDGPRMAPFRDAPEAIRADLLYLSYLDSLARYGRAVPPDSPDRNPNLGRLVARCAGVAPREIESWGLSPAPEPGQGELSSVFRELNRRQRLVLPVGDAALWTHLSEGDVGAGYVIFGQTETAPERQVDFCALVTAANRFQPEYSAVLYRDPASGELVHGNAKALPHIAYLGSGRPGRDLARVYHEYFRLRDQRQTRPLFPDMR
ncbi:MAG: hypothetical protein ABIL09_29640 [Gemmatimonadota bacterium]